VQSLNLVDLEFNGDSENEKAIRESWKILFPPISHLSEDLLTMAYLLQNNASRTSAHTIAVMVAGNLLAARRWY
jgi:hypothetical protein